MSLPPKQIDRPLGQPSGGRRTRGPRRGRDVLLGAVALALFATSAAVALRERPFRDAAPVAVSTPRTAEAADDGAVEAPRRAAAAQADATQADAAAGAPDPAIIRVDPAAAGSADSVVVLRDPATLGSDPRVAHLPDRALIEESESGPLPVRGADGRRPFDAYARPWSGARGARVAVVIGGLGLSQTGTQRAIETLPGEITLAFAPQGNSLDRWMRTARQGGHEIVMQVPLEPFDYPNVNPGRNTLTVGAPAGETLGELRWTLSRITNYTGVMNYMGGRFVADAGAMDGMMAELGRRGLMFLDDGTAARSVAEETALSNGVPFAAGDLVIDGARERGAILDRLDELERIARAQGFAVGTGSAFDVTVDAVASWAREARKRGIELVPISAVAHDPERSR
ncbi:divergent polysaccharide deacetylase family protein [Aquibium sp. A9E412]|uniref:divergent polysaccharide deacetylase family protein n=1 Tax=Aquibium sp. A9E412 TaxID=2976767 RepID=UPI0025B1B602|nr:divergent polysaccharide deacetylase family protein [Aquibium sp. A9E412]MDN2567743.1 divergent polysaccharide deacetylase family protein [Aquibium sp. A9E412]